MDERIKTKDLYIEAGGSLYIEAGGSLYIEAGGSLEIKCRQFHYW